MSTTRRLPYPAFQLLPRSFTLRVLAICFLGTHIPLIVAAIYAVSSMDGGVRAHAEILIIVLGATLVGTGLTLAAIFSVLRPINRSAAALKAYNERRILPDLPLDRTDEVGELMATVRVVCERLEAELRQQETLAQTDPLTGLRNRRAFFDGSIAILSDHRRTRQQVHFAMFDLDRFKALNDTYGHPAGDEVLKRFASILAQEHLPGQFVGRLGGEEFCMVLPGDAKATEDIVEAIRCRTQDIDLGLVPPAKLTVSIGVTEIRVEAEALVSDGALQRADEALYAAKEAGRNTIRWA